MHFLRAVAVNEELVDELWKKVSFCGSYYSIGDGVSREHFRRMLFESSVVLRCDGLVLRLEEQQDHVELHPIVLGHSAFRNATKAMKELDEVSARLFDRKPICCIIPNRMKGARALARSAGLVFRGVVVRALSGIEIPCGVWR